MPTIGGHLPRKVTVRVGGRKQVFAQRAGESDRHILLKALVFALYQSQFPDMGVERNIGHRYKPDLVVLGSDGTPLSGRSVARSALRSWPSSATDSRTPTSWSRNSLQT
jgi:hypothetical protein